MLSKVTQDVAELVEQKINHIIHNQLELIKHIDNIDRTNQSIAEDIFENIMMGILLRQENLLNTFSLLYRVINKSFPIHSKEITEIKLLNWLGTEHIRQYLIKKIMTHTFSENNYSTNTLSQHIQECKPDIQLFNSNNGYTNQQIKEVQAISIIVQSPSTTQHSNQQAEQQKQHLALNKPQNKNIYQSDLFQILTLTKNAQNSPKVKQQQVQQPHADQMSLQNDQIPASPCPKVHSQHFHQESQLILNTNHNSLKISQDSNEVSFQHEPFTVLKMRDDHPYNQEQQNLMSEVSSYGHQPDYDINLSIYQLEDTCRYGHFLYGDKVDKILRSFTSNQTALMLIKWLPRKSGFIPLQSIFQSSMVKCHSPNKLIEFYETLFK